MDVSGGDFGGEMFYVCERDCNIGGLVVVVEIVGDCSG